MREVHMRFRFLLAALLVLLSGCSFLGPTPDDVKEALEAVSRGLKASTGQSPRIDMQYSNIADISSASPDGTAVTKAKFMIDSAHALFIDGTCNLSGYLDKKSGYTIDGVVHIKLNDIKKDDPDAMTGSIEYSVTMTGGKIESLDVTVSRDNDGAVMTELVANGKKIDLEAWAEAERMMRSLAPGLVGR
jgi:hypothetical protein